MSPSSPKALLNHASNAWFSGIQETNGHITALVMWPLFYAPEEAKRPVILFWMTGLFAYKD